MRREIGVEVEGEGCVVCKRQDRRNMIPILLNEATSTYILFLESIVK